MTDVTVRVRTQTLLGVYHNAHGWLDLRWDNVVVAISPHDAERLSRAIQEALNGRDT